MVSTPWDRTSFPERLLLAMLLLLGRLFRQDVRVSVFTTLLATEIDDIFPTGEGYDAMVEMIAMTMKLAREEGHVCAPQRTDQEHSAA